MRDGSVSNSELVRLAVSDTPEDRARAERELWAIARDFSAAEVLLMAMLIDVPDLPG